MDWPLCKERQALWADRLRRYEDRLGGDRGLVVEGRLTRMVGLTLESVGCRAAIGGQCDVVSSNGTHIEAEVVGFFKHIHTRFFDTLIIKTIFDTCRKCL